MDQPKTRLLLSEDNPADQELELLELKRAGLRIAHRVAINAADFERELRDFLPDVIVSDFSMPGFDGMEALQLARKIAPETPFIFVSGTLGEDYAIRALKNGATDYVLKSNLVRLPAAIERALVGADERRARRRAENGLRRAQLMAKLAHVITGADGAFESWSESLPDLIGVEPAAMLRSTREWLDILHPDDRGAFRRASILAAQTGGRVDVEYRLRRDEGAWIHVRQVIEPLHADGHSTQAGRWFSTLQDITEQKEATNAVRRLNRVYAVLSGINTLIVRASTTEQLFSEACEIAVKHGQFPLAWIGLVDEARTQVSIAASAGDAPKYLAQMPLDLAGDGVGMAGQSVLTGVVLVSNDIENDSRILLRKEAHERGYQSLAMLPLTVAGKVIGVMALYAEQSGFFDDTELRLLNELAGDISFAVDHIEKARRLEFVSNYDALTGLSNRDLFMDRLGQAQTGTEPGRIHALAILDIERFKAINDSLGRAAGDALLSQLAQRLVDLAKGETGRVARTGPDQFAVMIPNVRALERVASAIEEGFRRVESEPFDIMGTALRAAVRCGIAVYPADGQDADSVFRNAEAALKKAKQRGDKYLFYRQEMTERIAERLSLENKLRLAIEKQEFVLHYQPKVDLIDRRIVGVEALIRWQSAEGLVPPLQFIGILEETGLIAPVGAWALRRAALDHRAWLEAGLPAPRVAVNVSQIQLRQADFVSMLEESIAEGSRTPGIDVEITESLLMDDVDANVEKLHAVRKLGIDIAIDDFGTGYSSLAYLSRLPVQALKIDRSFVKNMDKDPNAMTLVSTIISLAHSLKLKVVAEGVETTNQENTLRLLRCDHMQGYLISKPVPEEALRSLLSKNP